MIEQTLTQYKNGTIEAAKVIEELIEIAKNLRDVAKDEQESDLTSNEIAFYDALIDNGSAKEVMKDEQLRQIARVLVARLRKSVTIDWQLRKSARAKLKIEVKKVLNEFGYPPDESIRAIELVIKQAEIFGNEWSEER
jgi:type I restriction enzyme R subunit